MAHAWLDEEMLENGLNLLIKCMEEAGMLPPGCDLQHLREQVQESITELFGNAKDVPADIFLDPEKRKHLTGMIAAVAHHEATPGVTLTEKQNMRPLLAGLALGNLLDKTAGHAPRPGQPTPEAVRKNLRALLAAENKNLPPDKQLDEKELDVLTHKILRAGNIPVPKPGQRPETKPDAPEEVLNEKEFGLVQLFGIAKPGFAVAIQCAINGNTLGVPNIAFGGLTQTGTVAGNLFQAADRFDENFQNSLKNSHENKRLYGMMPPHLSLPAG